MPTNYSREAQRKSGSRKMIKVLAVLNVDKNEEKQ